MQLSLGDYSRESTRNMIQILSKQRTGLRVCHLNAQSLKNKLDEFTFIFESSGVDIVCISETWFTKDLLDNFLTMKGYVLYRADRSSHAGGCAIYIKDSLRCKVLAKSDDTSQIEFLFLEVTQNENKILIGTAYRPHHRINL